MIPDGVHCFFLWISIQRVVKWGEGFSGIFSILYLMDGGKRSKKRTFHLKVLIFLPGRYMLIYFLPDPLNALIPHVLNDVVKLITGLPNLHIFAVT